MIDSSNLFPNLPDEAKLWVYCLTRPLSDVESRSLDTALDEFFAQWTSHQRNVTGGKNLFENQVLVIGAYVPDGDLSGCGIDKHIHVIEELLAGFQCAQVGPLSVVYRNDSGQLIAVSRAEFRAVVEKGDVTASLPVLDLAVNMLGTARNTGIEKPASESWHGRVFAFTETVA